MEDKILELLDKEYQGLEFEVEFKEFRLYVIKFKIEKTIQEFVYKWDNTLTDNINIEIISKIINSKIIEYYKGEF